MGISAAGSQNERAFLGTLITALLEILGTTRSELTKEDWWKNVLRVASWSYARGLNSLLSPENRYVRLLRELSTT